MSPELLHDQSVVELQEVMWVTSIIIIYSKWTLANLNVHIFFAATANLNRRHSAREPAAHLSKSNTGDLRWEGSLHEKVQNKDNLNDATERRWPKFVEN